jgi:ubiquitin-conjugating enzyme E2 W
MALAYTRRLNKELAEIHAGTPVGINLVNADTFEKWLFTVEVMGTSEYEASQRYRPHLPVTEVDLNSRERSFC